MRRSTHNITHTLTRFLSALKRTNTAVKLEFSVFQICCKEKTNRLESTLHLQCIKLISCLFFFLLPKVLAFFISDAQHPQRCNIKENDKCCEDGVLCAICVDPTRSNVFTERSIPKLRRLTLSKMNNLFTVTLNLLSCNNCFCNLLPDMF